VAYLVASSFCHVVPELRSVGTALLAGVSVVSIILGLGAEHAGLHHPARRAQGTSHVQQRDVSNVSHHWRRHRDPLP